MKRLTVIALALFAMAFAASAQDIITTIDGDNIQAAIEEIGEDIIVYKDWSNPDGPSVKTPVSKVSRIQFRGGGTMVFSGSAEDLVIAEAPLPETPQSDIRQTEFLEQNVKTPAQREVSEPIELPINEDIHSPYAQPSGLGRLEHIKGEFYLDGSRLSPREIRDVIGDYNYYNTYDGAIRQRKAGKALVIAGGVTMGVGAGLLIAAFVSGGRIVVTHSWTEDGQGRRDSDSYSYDASSKALIPMLMAGSTLCSLGATTLVVGVPLFAIGNSRLNWIERDYNEQNNYAATVSFGATPYGIGLAMNF